MPSHLWCSARFSSRGSGPYFLSSTLLHSAHSSKPPQSTIIYTLMTPNYSSPSPPNSFFDSINHLLHVFKQISSWMTSNLLCLNPSKTEFILIGLRDQLKKIPDPSISLNLDSR